VPDGYVDADGGGSSLVLPLDGDSMGRGPKARPDSCRKRCRPDGVDVEEATADHGAAVDHVGSQPHREMAGCFVRVHQRVDQQPPPDRASHRSLTAERLFVHDKYATIYSHTDCKRIWSGMGSEYRLDELARQAGVASTTVRLYQTKGLLAPPRLEGRTGWYDDSHLSRLRLIARLQGEGYSLAGIANLLEQWEHGRSLGAVIGVEAELDALIGDVHAIVLDPVELLERLPEGSMTPDLLQRAASLALVQPTDDGKIRVADRRFLETGVALAHIGIPLDVILDEWEALVVHTDDIATRFVGLFETYLAPADWRAGLDTERARELAQTLGRLQATARQVLAAALDASVARLGRERLGELIER
jgi:DNA-binding transcriptional MerR regulator